MKSVSSIAAVLLPLALMACGQRPSEPQRIEPGLVAPGGAAEPAAKDQPGPVAFTLVEGPAQLATGGACNFDLIAGVSRDNETIEVTRDLAKLYTGWAAVAVEGGVLASDIRLVLAGAKTYELVTRADRRKDVADYFKVPALENAGFAATASAQGVDPGEYTLKVVLRGSGGQFECGVTKKVVVR
ncbi:hypothetical protein GCM10025771_25790 [Niveibacterium umoris]|uniref:Proteinase inhibitor I42 chagasin domain-containing protein n=1 Tax=Niveibacterium umoris TaxID=1193620 RepID=A0A840BHX2_9RHOO|nr:hypothetical protein [Niveibacterium umoris]MBB4012233.1 hypothetical protein [Niveibacterium umoris]